MWEALAQGMGVAMFSLPSPFPILSRLEALNGAVHTFDKIEISASVEQAVKSEHKANALWLVFERFVADEGATTPSSLHLSVRVSLVSYFTSSYDRTGQRALPSIFAAREALIAWLNGFIPNPSHDDYLRYQEGRLLRQGEGSYHYLDTFNYTSLRELPSVALADLVDFLSTHSSSPLINSQTSLNPQP